MCSGGRAVFPGLDGSKRIQESASRGKQTAFAALLNHPVPSVWISVRQHWLATDLKAAGDFLLRGADDLHRVAEAGAHCLDGQLGRIAIATEVPKDGATKLPFEEFAKDTGCSGVRKMAMPRHDALFDAP